MVTNKKRLRANIFAWLSAVVLLGALTGCTPPGPNALLRGKKLLDEGKVDAAIQELKTAATLLNTNAQAWNYLGVAYQRANQFPAALDAYQHALKFNRDLTIVHYNLGCLLLEQNRPDLLEPARNEFTAFNLHQPKVADGWLKLGAAQLRLGDWVAAEASFKEGYNLDNQSPEALNDLGTVKLLRRRYRESSAYFYAALRFQTNYAPAILNLAAAEYNLNNRLIALQKYQEYLALVPRPANWDSVNVSSQQLYLELNPTRSAVAVSETNPVNATPPARNTVVASNVVRSNVSIPARAATGNNSNPPRLVASNDARRSAEIVQITPSPTLTTGREVSEAENDGSNTNGPKKNFLQKLNPLEIFHRRPTPRDTTSSRLVTPHEAGEESVISSTEAGSVAKTTAAPTAPRAPAVFPRYRYTNPARPASGNRSAAEQALAKGADLQRGGQSAEALTAYGAAIQADPSFFDAQNAFASVSLEQGQNLAALRAYETALAISPDSFNGHFNFAMALKKSGYYRDAAQELEKLLAANPVGESVSHLATVHLALANLYSEQFHQPTLARLHYQKVLELDPHNPQATAIRYWLQDNP